MPRAEVKRPIGVPESIYLEMEKYARDHNLFIFEVVTEAWEKFKENSVERFKENSVERKTKKRRSNR